MERCHHFGLAVGRACHMVCCRESPNGFCSGVLIIEPDKVARIEVDHNTSRLRSSLMACVESVPPRRYLRLARNRSEEHTSELQSRLHLVCRLLLEKKNKNDSACGASMESESAFERSC